MLRNRSVMLIVFAMLGSALFTGCGKTTPQPPVTAGSTEITASDTKEETTKAQVDTTITDRNFNHGHSISEASADRFGELRRSDDVLTDKDQAKEYLENSIPVGCTQFEFKLTDTSDDDQGSFMWYEFTAVYNGIRINNAEFRVVTFTDGTICEGKNDIFTCSFSDPDDVIDKTEALNIYSSDYNDDRDYEYIESCYFFTGKRNSTCNFTYIYKYDCGKFNKNNTIVLNAKTGEMIGCWPDAID